MTKRKTMSSLIRGQRVVPVVVINNQDEARGLAKALLAGGVNVIEVTLRNDYGVQAIELIKQEFPEMLVLAGTVNSVLAVDQVVNAGVDGIISPGVTANLVSAALAAGVPIMPGVATASEILLAMEFGLTELKLFPASVVGGVSALKALAGPFGDIRFCPTGGISADDYQDYLALDNVMCVGGSWLAPKKLVAEGRWGEITDLCTAISNMT